MRHKEHHRRAQLRNEPGYFDPETDLFVMTEKYLRSRGHCCGNGCRHCPYGRNVVETCQTDAIELQLPAHLPTLPDRPLVLFWSGGKDSYLALLKLLDTETNIVLLTTYANGVVGHQDINIDVIKRQAHHLQLPLLLTPLKHQIRYEVTVSEALSLLNPRGLAFGDLHLAGIRQWREEHFANHALHFPIWNVNYQTLFEVLDGHPGRIKISALGDTFPDDCPIEVGDSYTRATADVLEDWALDAFGERGEFHTVVEFW